MSRINNTEVLFHHFLKTALNIVTHFEQKDQRDKRLKELQEIITKSCVYDEKIRKLNETINELVESINEDESPEEVMKEFTKQKEEILKYNPDVRNHPNLKQYCSDVKEIVDEADGLRREKTDDEDIQMVQNNINIIDPFTKKRMTNPVKNKICGHVYDRESVISILQMKKDTRCPVIGCINKQFILEENLVSDISTKKFLQKNLS